MKNDLTLHRDTCESSLISIAGYIDVSTIVNFREQMMSIAQGSTKDLTLNCKELKYIDSVGLAVLIGAQKILARKNLRVDLINVSEPIKKLLNITRLDLVFGIAG